MLQLLINTLPGNKGDGILIMIAKFLSFSLLSAASLYIRPLSVTWPTLNWKFILLHLNKRQCSSSQYGPKLSSQFCNYVGSLLPDFWKEKCDGITKVCFYIFLKLEVFCWHKVVRCLKSMIVSWCKFQWMGDWQSYSNFSSL